MTRGQFLQRTSRRRCGDKVLEKSQIASRDLQEKRQRPRSSAVVLSYLDNFSDIHAARTQALFSSVGSETPPGSSRPSVF